MFEDDPLVTVTTPDGRVVTLPQSVAASFSSLQPVAPAPAPPAPALQAAPALAAPPPPAQVPAFVPPRPEPAPASGSSPSGPGAPSIAPDHGPVTRPGADQGTQPTRQPPPEPALTNADLAKQGPAGTLAQYNRAYDKEAAATDEAIRVEVEQAKREGQIYADRNARVNAELDKAAQQAQQNQAELEARIRKHDQLADQIANTKIDRSIDRPILSAIGLVLSMFGTAMTTRPGDKWDDPAMNALMQQIDRKVDLQMKNLDLKRAALAEMNQGITTQRQLNEDRMAMRAAIKDGELKKADLAIQQYATQMKEPAALARADMARALLDKERAGIRDKVGEQEWDRIKTREAQSLQRAGLAQAERHFQKAQEQAERHFQAQERSRLAEIAAKALERDDKITAERAKKVEEGALYDPRTRNPLLNPAGQKKYAEADRLEAEARKTQDPALAARQRKQAADLRDSAVLNDSIVVSPKVAEELRSKMETVQDLTDQIGTVTAAIEQAPGVIDREKWAGIQTRLSNIAFAYQRMAGERPSVRAFEQVVKHITDFDPASIFDRTASLNKAKASLNELKGIISDDINSRFGTNGVKTNWQPVSRQEAGIRLDLGEKTAAEEGAEQNAGWITRAGARIVTGGTKGYDDFGFQRKAMEDAASRPGSEAGLSPNATTRVKLLAQKADKSGDAERAQIVQTLAAPIVAGLGTDGRQSVAWGMLQVIQTQNPELYDEVVSALPREQAELVRGMNRVGPTLTGTPPLGPSGFDPDRSAEAARQRAARERAAAEAEYYRTHPVPTSPAEVLRRVLPGGTGSGG
jgi:hypothetical protein